MLDDKARSFTLDNLTTSFRRAGTITFITDLPCKICQRSTDPTALRELQSHARRTVIRHLPGIHAKVYVADEGLAIVGSGNLTAGGLYQKFDYALELRTRSIIQRIKRDVLDYGALGADVSAEVLDAYCDACDELRRLFDEQQRSSPRGSAAI